jgi:uncharacterized LabA/DUF88 family protein
MPKTEVKQFVLKLANTRQYRRLKTKVNESSRIYYDEYSSYTKQEDTNTINKIVESLSREIEWFERGILRKIANLPPNVLNDNPLEIFSSYIKEKSYRENGLEFLEAVDRNIKRFLPTLYRFIQSTTINKIKSNQSFQNL